MHDGPATKAGSPVLMAQVLIKTGNGDMMWCMVSVTADVSPFQKVPAEQWQVRCCAERFAHVLAKCSVAPMRAK